MAKSDSVSSLDKLGRDVARALVGNLERSRSEIQIGEGEGPEILFGPSP